MVLADFPIFAIQKLNNTEGSVPVCSCFQPFIDFVTKHPEYDGALIYTDGYAQHPDIPANMRTPLCWVLRSEKELKAHEHWMRQSGRVCVIDTP